MHSRSLSSLFAAGDLDDHENSPENSADSPPSSIFNDNKASSSSSPKRSRRAVQKRVEYVPIRDVEGSRLKGETNTPPPDSWAWRKYGQKPIKGSPYPRGYYRCSSSKGCPARKQVERSRVDPTMVMVTYSCEHNHSWPASRSNNQNHNHHNTTTTTAPTSAAATPATTNEIMTNDDVTTSNSDDQDDKSAVLMITTKSEQEESDAKFTGLGDGSLLTTNQFWFSDLESTCSTMLESPLMTSDSVADADMAMIFSIREEDESFFADLGELPECATVFRRRVMEREEEHRRCSLTPWCGTT